MEDLMKDRIEQLVDYIMKRCLWQFHSRNWDRKKQNEGILTKTMQVLCGESPEQGTPTDKCYWVDALCLANGFKRRFLWLEAMDIADIKVLMQGLKERIDYLTITGSLNLELTDQHY
jgi:nitrogenase delta subunit